MIYNPNNGVSYRVFTAIVKPDFSMIVLENTLTGLPVIGNAGAGARTLTLAGEFPAAKTFLSANSCGLDQDNFFVNGFRRDSDDVLYLHWTTPAGGEDPSSDTFIEIRVYP